MFDNVYFFFGKFNWDQNQKKALRLELDTKFQTIYITFLFPIKHNLANSESHQEHSKLHRIIFTLAWAYSHSFITFDKV